MNLNIINVSYLLLGLITISLLYTPLCQLTDTYNQYHLNISEVIDILSIDKI